MNISYTESGKNELEEFKKRQVELLEEIVSQRKYVFGDGVTEVTGSDVRDASTQIRPIPRVRSRYALTELVAKLYVIIGTILALGGITWPYLRELRQQPEFLFIVSGVLMAILGILMQLYFRARARRFTEFEAAMRTLNRERKPDKV